MGESGAQLLFAVAKYELLLIKSELYHIRY